MTTRLPYPLPNKWDPAGPYRNPGGTNPLPAPTNMPSPCWFGPRLTGSWQVDADPQLLNSFFWRSPIFDMRPYLRGLVPDGAASAPGKVSGLPMWAQSAQLYVQVESPSVAGGLSAADLRGLEVLATERAHISNPQLISPVSVPQDLTEEFSVVGDSVILGWSPYGDSAPVRYWQLELKFQVRDNLGNAALPPLTITPAMY